MKRNRLQSQREQIKVHLLSGKRITRLMAINDYQCLELPTRIWEIINWDKIPVEKEMLTNANGTRYAEYFVVPSDPTQTRLGI